MTTLNDCWTQETFEDTVARALITCFETRIRKSRGAGPNSLNAERAALIRKAGPYIPDNEREIIAPATPSGPWEFDLVNDRLPVSGCLAMPVNHRAQPDKYGGFFRAIYVRQRSAVGATWRRRAGGQVYELIYMASENEYVEGERSFFTVTKAGQVVSCEERLPSTKGYNPGVRTEILTTAEDELRQIEACASVALQYLADRRFCWMIEAREHGAFVRLGCQEEQVKSLLYARTLPMTETGRKRPILHLVEAHKRRLRNGTEIDIPASTRGIQAVEIGGTQFVVRPAQAVIPTLSAASRSRLQD